MRTTFIRLRDEKRLIFLSPIFRFLALCLLFVATLNFAPSCSRHLSVSLKGEQVEFNLAENDSLQFHGSILGTKK